MYMQGNSGEQSDSYIGFCGISAVDKQEEAFDLCNEVWVLYVL
jgi:hypothetical protein